MFLSLATAMIVTRVTTAQSMTEQASTQLSKPAPFFISAGILLLLGVIPGMPHLVFLLLGAVTVGLGYLMLQKAPPVVALPTPAETAAAAAAAPKELDWNDVEHVDLIGLEIGYGLIPLVNAETGGQLMSRVKGVRKKLSTELGFLIPTVRIRDALNLDPDTYNIVLNGVVRASGQSVTTVSSSQCRLPYMGPPTAKPV
jgi:flagellar biosynthesis protein FlhA